MNTNKNAAHDELGGTKNKQFKSLTNEKLDDYSSIKYYEITNQFRQAMHSAGIHYYGDIVANGMLQRFHIDKHKSGSKNGAYVLHADGSPAGWFMDYTTGLYQTWSLKSSLPAGAASRFHSQAKNNKRQREEERLKLQRRTALRARETWWAKSKPISKQSDHPYLVTKNIQPHIARLSRDGNELIIPICNGDMKSLVNLQLIDSKGNKRFLVSGEKKGCFSVIGKKKTDRILICEGFSTGASLHEAYDQRVIIALDAGNLLPVSKNIRRLYPNNPIIICGDNDASGTGQFKANNAAVAIGAKIFIPKTYGDWNDHLSGRVPQ